MCRCISGPKSTKYVIIIIVIINDAMLHSKAAVLVVAVTKGARCVIPTTSPRVAVARHCQFVCGAACGCRIFFTFFSF